MAEILRLIPGCTGLGGTYTSPHSSFPLSASRLCPSQAPQVTRREKKTKRTGALQTLLHLTPQERDRATGKTKAKEVRERRRKKKRKRKKKRALRLGHAVYTSVFLENQM